MSIEKAMKHNKSLFKQVYNRLELKLWGKYSNILRLFTAILVTIDETLKYRQHLQKNVFEHFPAAIQPLFSHQAELNLIAICTRLKHIGNGFGKVHFSQIERLGQDAQSSEIPRRSMTNATSIDEHLNLSNFVFTYFLTAILVEGNDSSNHMLCFLRCVYNHVALSC